MTRKAALLQSKQSDFTVGQSVFDVLVVLEIRKLRDFCVLQQMDLSVVPVAPALNGKAQLAQTVQQHVCPLTH